MRAIIITFIGIVVIACALMLFAYYNSDSTDVVTKTIALEAPKVALNVLIIGIVVSLFPYFLNQYNVNVKTAIITHHARIL